MSCLWKLLGDACTIIQPIPEDTVKMNVPNKLLGLDQTDEGSSTEVAKKDLLALGAR